MSRICPESGIQATVLRYVEPQALARSPFGQIFAPLAGSDRADYQRTNDNRDDYYEHRFHAHSKAYWRPDVKSLRWASGGSCQR